MHFYEYRTIIFQPNAVVHMKFIFVIFICKVYKFFRYIETMGQKFQKPPNSSISNLTNARLKMVIRVRHYCTVQAESFVFVSCQKCRKILHVLTNIY